VINSKYEFLNSKQILILQFYNVPNILIHWVFGFNYCLGFSA